MHPTDFEEIEFYLWNTWRLGTFFHCYEKYGPHRKKIATGMKAPYIDKSKSINFIQHTILQYHTHSITVCDGKVIRIDVCVIEYTWYESIHLWAFWFGLITRHSNWHVHVSTICILFLSCNLIIKFIPFI